MLPIVIVQCNKCGKRQKFQPTKLTYNSYWGNKRKKCIKCDKYIRVKNCIVRNLTDNVKAHDFVNYKIT